MNLIALENKIRDAATTVLGQWAVSKGTEPGGFFYGFKTGHVQESCNTPCPQIFCDRPSFSDKEKTDRYIFNIGFFDKSFDGISEEELSLIHANMVGLYKNFKRELDYLLPNEALETVGEVQFYKNVLDNVMSGVIASLVVEGNDEC